MVQFDGEIVNTRPYGTHTATQMGSGRFAYEGFRRAFYFRNLQVVDWDNNLIPLWSLHPTADHSNCYSVQGGSNRVWGSYLYYGGLGKSEMQYTLFYLMSDDSISLGPDNFKYKKICKRAFKKYLRPGARPSAPVVGTMGPPGQIRPPLCAIVVVKEGNSSSGRAFGSGLDFTLPSHKSQVFSWALVAPS